MATQRGTGTGGPGYKFEDEKVQRDHMLQGQWLWQTLDPIQTGVNSSLCMANRIFLPNYTIFGHVSEGMDVIDMIASANVTYGNSGEQSTPVDPVKIMSIEISPAVSTN